jgi:hypothetical protein
VPHLYPFSFLNLLPWWIIYVRLFSPLTTPCSWLFLALHAGSYCPKGSAVENDCAGGFFCPETTNQTECSAGMSILSFSQSICPSRNLPVHHLFSWITAPATSSRPTSKKFALIQLLCTCRLSQKCPRNAHFPPLHCLTDSLSLPSSSTSANVKEIIALLERPLRSLVPQVFQHHLCCRNLPCWAPLLNTLPTFCSYLCRVDSLSEGGGGGKRESGRGEGGVRPFQLIPWSHKNV